MIQNRFRRDRAAHGMRRTRGFTLVELLATIAIVALLVALLVPAIQGGREAARRTWCGNNLRQLATGCLGYESIAGQFPYGRKYDIWDSYTWTQLVLPWIEQRAVHDNYWTLHDKGYRASYPGPNGPIGDDARLRAARQALIATLYCPSDRAPTQNEFNTAPYGFLRGNYSGCAGSGDMYGNAVDATSGPWGKGIFRVLPGQTFDDGPDGTESAAVTDGGSNTALLSELLVCDVPWWGGPIGETIYGNMGGALFSVATTPNTSVADRVCGPCPQRQGDAAYSAPCTDLGAAWWTPSAANAYAAARSRHVAGVNVARGDASLVFVGDTVDLRVWRSLGTRAGQPGAEAASQP